MQIHQAMSGVVRWLLVTLSDVVVTVVTFSDVQWPWSDVSR